MNLFWPFFWGGGVKLVHLSIIIYKIAVKMTLYHIYISESINFINVNKQKELGLSYTSNKIKDLAHGYIFVSSRIIVITIIFRKELSGHCLLKLDRWDLISSTRKFSCCGIRYLSFEFHLDQKKKK